MSLKSARPAGIKMAFIQCLKKRGMLQNGFLFALPVTMFLILAILSKINSINFNGPINCLTVVVTT